MGLFDNIRARRAARRAEKGREVFAQNALFDNTMSSLYGKDWRSNAQINNDRMREQFAANKNLFLQEATKRIEANRPEPTSPNVPIPGQAVTQRLDDIGIRENEPSPVIGNINAGVQRFNRQAIKSASDKRWLNEANRRLANISKELGYNFGKLDSIDDVSAIQRYLGVTADGKFGQNTEQAFRNAYRNGDFGYTGLPEGNTGPTEAEFFSSLRSSPWTTSYRQQTQSPYASYPDQQQQYWPNSPVQEMLNQINALGGFGGNATR